MRLKITTALILMTFFCSSQTDTVENVGRFHCKINWHELEMDPLSIWYGKHFSLAQRIKYTFLIDDKNRVSLESNAVLFNDLDANALGGRWQGVYPKLNKTQLSYDWGVRYFHRENRKGKKRFTKMFLRGGYHYFQHSTGRNNFEYWAVDSSDQTGLRSIGGFRSHSGLIGVSFEKQFYRFKNKKVRSFNHRLSLDYLFSPRYDLKLYDSEVIVNQNSQWEKSTLPYIQSGGQLSYRFLYNFNRTFGIHADAEVLWVPFLDGYQPNSNYFVPRGGEKISPLFVNIRFGFYWAF